MKTITITQARKNLSGWLTRASSGEEIGIINGDQIVSLKPVQVTELNYAESEYGIGPADMDTICENILKKSNEAAKAGEYVSLETFTSSHAAPARKTGKLGHRSPQRSAAK